MPYDNNDYLSRHFQTTAIDLGDKLDELISMSVPPGSPNQALYREMLMTVVRMAEADRNRWDAKIMLQTLREMENAFSMLEQFKRRRKVTVFGSARTPTDHPLYLLARELGKLFTHHDLMTVTGAGDGIMAAAHEGAGLEHSLGLNIALPFEQRANEVVHGTGNLLSFHFFFLRKLFFVKEADAMVLFPGGFGTLDEALEVLTLIQTGKSPIVPVVMIDVEEGRYWKDFLHFVRQQLEDNRYILPSDMSLIKLVSSAEEAAVEITHFYRNYHSSRWLKGDFAIRMNRPLTTHALQQLHEGFGDLCVEGGFSQQPYCELERDEPEFCHLTRLTFRFNGRDQGRLRQLIDFINLPQNWQREGATGSV
ncbi:TIGR00730 family Rossman fold protein [Pseudomonas sp. NW5]|uniref:LOG family protein n=1 Tax=Pseudomonas sp. NW5 TaxID=2934934 RepID=UPI0020207239|nr:TIGR00730 family Rossman fold protein [Pseudomonas sp. NW5]MCL7462298.1 TIGR00730 family Rossman fold protein [Pseudomonas sp. NW5]